MSDTTCLTNSADELLKPKSLSNLEDAEYAQPLCTALQVGLVNLLRRWNVKPHCVVGHSSGEIAAAYATNAITSAEAILVAYYRGLVTKAQHRAGAMAAIGLGREDVTPFLISGVVLACENSPESVTLSGDVDKLDEVMATIKAQKPDTLNRKLRVSKAYHSRRSLANLSQFQSILNIC